MSILLRKYLAGKMKLSESQLDHVINRFIHKKLKKHQFLVQEGEMVTHNFYVVAGCMKAYHTDKNGKEHILQFAMEDWWITDYQAYYFQIKATISIDCIEACEVYGISHSDMEKLCAELPEVNHFFRKRSSYSYVMVQQRILSMLTSNAEERYQRFVMKYPELFKRVPKQFIAAYLGVSRETLSRLSAKKNVTKVTRKK